MDETAACIETARQQLHNSEARVARQREIVSWLKATNRPVERSETLLATFEDLHRMRTSYLKVLQARSSLRPPAGTR